MRDTDPEAADVAVVGMACRFPGAHTPAQYWKNLREGVESIRAFQEWELDAAGVPRETRHHPDFVNAGAPLEGMDHFDAGFFNFTPRSASIMDPQHRHFLECAWESLEDAGHPPASFAGAIGVFAGCGANDYLVTNLLSNPELVHSVGRFLLRHTGNDKDFLATRVSYELDLGGPSINVQTACSTSLVAVHMACQSLLDGECDLALAGGVTIMQPHTAGYIYRDREILSPDGRCRAFDASARGTVFGSGAGIVVLRPLRDALADEDTIYATVRATAVNNDGASKVGYLAPSAEGQARVISEALELADVHPETIGYIEAHGTGTPIGDSIEVAALTQAFRLRTERTGFCVLGSVKPNIGHLDTAAGIAGFIKAVLALHHGELPPSLHVEHPLPGLAPEESPFRLNTSLRRWPREGRPRRAGVSSLGVGGTNAHAILEEAPAREKSGPSRDWQLLLLSGRSEEVVEGATLRLARHLEEHPETRLADVAHTLRVGRKAFRHRRALVVEEKHGAAAETAEALLERRSPRLLAGTARSAPPDLAFMFAGGGSQYPGMAAGLLGSEAPFRRAVDACLERLDPHVDFDLRRLLFSEGAPLDEARKELERPTRALLALFVIQYAQAKLWMEWGIAPGAMIGHSLGEYTAACLADVLSLDDALSLVRVRGELFERVPEGAMLSVGLAEPELVPLLGPDLSLAAVNGPALCVASGPGAAIDALAGELRDRDVETGRIRIDVAAHSSMLDPLLDDFREVLHRVRLRPPRIRFVSNLTGTWVTEEEATDPEYWVRQLRHTVHFGAGLETLLEIPERILLEVGPGRTLATLARIHPHRRPEQAIFTSLRHPEDQGPDLRVLLSVLGRLWLEGVEVDWSAFAAGESRRRIPLPAYPFEQERHWVEPGRGGSEAAGGIADAGLEEEAAGALPAPGPEEDPDRWLYAPFWRRAEPLAAPEDPPEEAVAVVLFLQEGESLGAGLATRLAAAGLPPVVVHPGEEFSRKGAHHFVIRPGSEVDYLALVDALFDSEAVERTVIGHLWSLEAGDEARARDEIREIERFQVLSFSSLLLLARALAERDRADGIRLRIVTDRVHRVAGEERLHPRGALTEGPARVIPREFPGIDSRAVDIARPLPGSPSEQRLLEQLLSELLSAREPEADGSRSGSVAYRGPDRWTRDFGRARLTTSPSGPLARSDSGSGMTSANTGIRDEGVYLITGGLGGIGLQIAAEIARAARVTLVLTSRRGLPPRSTWPEESADPAIRMIRSIESGGSSVMAAAADVSELEAMRKLILTIRERFGIINGVVHAAGVLDDGIIQLKSVPSAEAVLLPKVRGTLVLEDAVKAADLDFLLLCSSQSSIVAPPGQIDYVSANAFLDAFAQDRCGRGGAPVMSVNWALWRETGMAARLARMAVSQGSAAAGNTRGDAVRKMTIDEEWMLAEHRVPDGTALLPGTGYLHLVRERCGAGAMEMRDVLLLAPFAVRPGEARDLRVEMRPEGDGSAFRVLGRRAEIRDAGGRGADTDARRESAGPSRSAMRQESEGSSSGWTEHARGHLRPAEASEPLRHDLSALAARFASVAPASRPEDPHLLLGPRWENVEEIRYGAGEALAVLRLPSDCRDDLTEYPLHPALLDRATAGAQRLIDGYEAETDFYVPAAYGAIQIRGRLPARCFSHIRCREGDGDGVAVFDVTVMDEAGVELVAMRDFTMIRVKDRESRSWSPLTESSEAGSPREPEDSREPVDPAALPRALASAFHSGIDSLDGARVFRRLIEDPTHPQIVVSPRSFDAVRREAEEPHRRGGPGRGVGITEKGGGAPEVDLSPLVAALMKHPAVADAWAMARAGSPGGADRLRVVAYVVPDPSERITVSELRRDLRRALPADLIPRNFVELDRIPRDGDGGVRPEALPDPFAPEEDHAEPQTEMEVTIAGIWKELLGVERIGIHDNFLDIGGHSLLTMRALVRIEKATGVRLGPVEMNLHTLQQIAARCADASGSASPPKARDDADAPAADAPARSPAGIERLLAAVKHAVTGAER